MRQPISSFRLLAAGLVGLSATAIPLTARPAAASDALWALQGSLQGCVESSQPKPCRQAEARVKGLTRNPAYAKASHLCKEEIGELSQIVSLLPLQDAVPTEVMASVADVQQACLPYGF
ncbi:MAG: hypothetical protein RLZZ533_1561 [Cyanobacteriota bacterium]|jgi:hypothetical protein